LNRSFLDKVIGPATLIILAVDVSIGEEESFDDCAEEIDIKGSPAIEVERFVLTVLASEHEVTSSTDTIT